MPNTFLMNPFIGEEDESLLDLVRPLIAISFLKDVRSVSVNINEYIQKEDQNYKLQDIKEEESQESSKAQAPGNFYEVQQEELDPDSSSIAETPADEALQSEPNGQESTTAREVPACRQFHGLAKRPIKNSTLLSDDVVPDDEHKRGTVTEFTSKSECFTSLNRMAKHLTAQRSQNWQRKHTAVHVPSDKRFIEDIGVGLQADFSQGDSKDAASYK